MQTVNGYDVVVFGGGMCGVSAALKIADAASEGTRILIVESRPVLGWEATWGGQLELVKGVSDLADVFAGRMATAGAMKGNWIDAPIAEMVLQRMASEKKIDLLYNCRPLALAVEDNRVQAVLTGAKGSMLSIQARMFVDATETALLMQRAGVAVGPRPTQKASYTLFMNRVPDDNLLPDGVAGPSSEVAIRRSIWPGEVAFTFATDTCSIGQARVAAPDIIRAVRAQVHGLDQAIVTHFAHTVFPYDSVAIEDSGCLDNLIGAGPWLGQGVEHRQLTGRICIGEAAADKVGAVLGKLPEPRGGTTAFGAYAAERKACDVLVCGGGTAGSVAAIVSARQGAGTVLLESSTCLGGIGTGGAIHSYYYGVAGGVQDEIDQRVADLTPLFAPAEQVGGFHPEVKKIILQQMADEAGVATQFETTVTSVETDAHDGGTEVKSVTAADDNGAVLHSAQVVIDSTGDGDVAAMAGARYTFGRPTDALTHAFSQSAGYLRNDAVLFGCNFDAGYCDPTDARDFTRARCVGLNHLWQERFTSENRPLYMAPLLGLRDSRLIAGDYVLTLDDEIECRQFDDVVAYAYSHLDNHAVDYENEPDQVLLWVWVHGYWPIHIGCQIPYRCLLPEGLDNVLIACRAMSMEHNAHYQLRMQRDMQRIGEVAGIAAALAVKEHRSPRQVDHRKIQEQLTQSGALDAGDTSWQPERVCAPGVDDYLAGLCADDLRKQLRDRCEDKVEGYRAAPAWQVAVSLLGMLECREAVKDIEGVLNDEQADLDALTAAVHALGRIGDESSAPAILKMLERSDISCMRRFPGAVSEDARWHLEISSARALKRLGRPQPEIVEKYRRDRRAHVRRYAELA